MRSHATTNINRRTLLASTAAAGAVLAMPAIVRAQGGPLKVGVLLPRSGVQALIGQDCQRGVELAPPILKDLGLPELTIMNADTETNVDTARSRAERLISDGAQLLVGAFDSGPDQRDRPGRRAEGHPARRSTSRPRRRSPSRATSSCSATSRPRR